MMTIFDRFPGLRLRLANFHPRDDAFITDGEALGMVTPLSTTALLDVHLYLEQVDRPDLRRWNPSTENMESNRELIGFLERRGVVQRSQETGLPAETAVPPAIAENGKDEEDKPPSLAQIKFRLANYRPRAAAFLPEEDAVACLAPASRGPFWEVIALLMAGPERPELMQRNPETHEIHINLELLDFLEEHGVIETSLPLAAEMASPIPSPPQSPQPAAGSHNTPPGRLCVFPRQSWER